MKVSIISVVLMAEAAFAAIPCHAQQADFMTVPGEAKTPIERTLQIELPMPGFGISSSRTQLMNRFEYALDHKWLTAEQVQQLCNELKVITDRTESNRDEKGKLSYEQTASAAKQLNSLNARFEELVLHKEQSSSNLDGLRARRALMIQRVSKAESDGKLNSQRAEELIAEINALSSSLNRKRVHPDELKTTESNLSRLSQRIDQQLSNTAIATRELPAPSNTIANLKAPFASISPRIRARFSTISNFLNKTPVNSKLEKQGN